MIERLAYAKVNLSLHITGKRDDGYHFLDSLVVFCDIADRITLSPAKTLSISVSGPFADGVPKDHRNIVWRTARLMSQTRTAHIAIEKMLPHGAGIGGGSADAAAAMAGLAELWNTQFPSIEQLTKLGADVPVCMKAPQAMRMRGLGEVLTPVKLPPLWLVLVNPGIHLATGEVFAARDHEDMPGMAQLPQTPNFDEFAVWLADQRNDLAPAAMSLAPEIEQVIAALWNIDTCVDADMSGSGSTCRGVFETRDDADAAAAELSQAYPNWWVRAAAVS